LNPIVAFLLVPALVGGVALIVAHAIAHARKRGRVPASPHARHLVAGRASTTSACRVALELAEADATAVALARIFREAVASAERAERDLAPVERDRLEIYQEHLER